MYSQLLILSFLFQRNWLCSLVSRPEQRDCSEIRTRCNFAFPSKWDLVVKKAQREIEGLHSWGCRACIAPMNVTPMKITLLSTVEPDASLKVPGDCCCMRTTAFLSSISSPFWRKVFKNLIKLAWRLRNQKTTPQILIIRTRLVSFKAQFMIFF